MFNKRIVRIFIFYYITINICFSFRYYTIINVSISISSSIELDSNLSLFYQIISIKVGLFILIQYMNINTSLL